MGLFSKIKETQVYGDVPFIGIGQHKLVVVKMEQFKTRKGADAHVTLFEVLESKRIVDGEEVDAHDVGSKVKAYADTAHELDIFLKKVKGVTQAAIGSLWAESPDEVAHVSGEEIDEPLMIEACFGPFEYEVDEASGEEVVVLGGKGATLGNDDANAAALRIWGGIPKIAEGAEPGTMFAGAVVECVTWQKPGKKYTVSNFSPLPQSEHPDFENRAEEQGE